MPTPTLSSTLTPINLLELRQYKLKLTKDELAQWLGLSNRSIRDYEAGRTPIPWLIQLAMEQELLIRKLESELERLHVLSVSNTRRH